MRSVSSAAARSGASRAASRKMSPWTSRKRSSDAMPLRISSSSKGELRLSASAISSSSPRARPAEDAVAFSAASSRADARSACTVAASTCCPKLAMTVPTRRLWSERKLACTRPRLDSTRPKMAVAVSLARMLNSTVSWLTAMRAQEFNLLLEIAPERLHRDAADGGTHRLLQEHARHRERLQLRDRQVGIERRPNAAASSETEEMPTADGAGPQGPHQHTPVPAPQD